MMKISLFIIALILVGGFATTFTFMTMDLSTKYSADYDNETLEVFQETQELHELAVELEEKNNEQNIESGIIDMVGAYIGRALGTVKLSISSFSVFESMTSTATEKAQMPGYFKQIFISIALILIVFAFIGIMVKWDV